MNLLSMILHLLLGDKCMDNYHALKCINAKRGEINKNLHDKTPAKATLTLRSEIVIHDILFGDAQVV